ncbi:hypothetical protein [Microbispora sp. ATCC PTA-5024]|uniref:hypothetical protein n=1 Tax=Microbispora sp. ATCC PTA-5024 TaxID=316330 RepID=UPI0003DCF14C|nr:hypothetical protein [Microbispora sp. ATCC PTA-5024]ETK36877.1 hypothetical protein MPTA5024_06700 [Microbispora sp. ATCC PTA-5024]
MGITSSPAARAGLAGLSIAALLAGCGSEPERSRERTGAVETAPSTPPPVSTPASANSPPPASPSPSPSPSPSELTACRKADCEVEVHRGDRLVVDPGFGLDSITVTSLADEGVMLAVENSTGRMSVEGGSARTSGSCTDGRCHGEAEIALSTGGQVRVNGVRLRVSRADSTRATLTVRPSA